MKRRRPLPSNEATSGTASSLGETPPEALLASMRAAHPELDDEALARLWRRPLRPPDLELAVQRAMTVNDEQDRDEVAFYARELLAAGEPLPEPIRRWLVWALDELIERDKLPGPRAGRPASRLRSDRLGIDVALILLWLTARPDPPAKVDLDAAIASEMKRAKDRWHVREAVGESRVKQIRQSADFDRYLELARGMLQRAQERDT